MNRIRSLGSTLSFFVNDGIRLLALTLLIVNLAQPVSGPDAEHPTFSIVNAGVGDAEDAPFVSNSYRFQPGEYVYFSFQVSGLAIKADEEKQTRVISLHYEVTPVDAHGVPLTQSAEGDVDAQLNPEDKNWIPKRRCSFLLPSFVAAGDYSVQVTATDRLGNKKTLKNVPFQVGGVTIKSTPEISIQNFRFTREEGGTRGLEVPAYRPGDSVYTDFVLAGFQFAHGNQYHVSYSVAVTGPDGKPFVSAGNAADLHSEAFYPPQYLPGNFLISTNKSSLPGRYVVIVSARDLIGKHDVSTQQIFSLE